jgi:CRP-like cAMP-binding protein
MLLGRINYSVKATATCKTIYARISPSQFCEIADVHPELWKCLAQMLAERLDKANAGRAQRKTISG